MLVMLVACTSAKRALHASFPTCLGVQPTMQNSEPDASGYLYGQSPGTQTSCVFRNSDGSQMFYTALISSIGAVDVNYASGPPSLPATGISWLDQPRCANAPTSTSGADWDGHLWGYENGRSCVFRTPASFPILANDVQAGQASWMYNMVPDHMGGYQLAGAQGAASPPPPRPAVSAAAPAWQTAPACPMAPDASVTKDSNGMLWGWASGASCAFRDSGGNPVYPSPTSSGGGGSGGTGGGGDWRYIPACPMAPTFSDLSSVDSYGHLWGFANGASCAFRDGNGFPIYPTSR